MRDNLSFEEWRGTGKYFTHRNHSIFYQTQGSNPKGPALLLIHGFPTASWDWHRIWKKLADKFSFVIAPDMIGFGYSAKPLNYTYSIRDQADLHEELLRSLDIKNYHVLSHDLGDTVTQELLARRLEGTRSPKLLSACLLNGGLFPETHRPVLMQNLLSSPIGSFIAAFMTKRRFQRAFSATFGPNTQPTAMEISEFWRLIEHNHGRRVLNKLLCYIKERRQNRDRWVGALQKSDVSLRVIVGCVDPISGAHMLKRYHELVPRPDTVLLPEIGHYPQVEAPNEVLKAFFEFHERL